MRSQEEILEASEKKLGRTLRGKWRLDRLIGVGGMAAVFDATRVDRPESPTKRVALKLLHPELSRSPELTRRFSQEASAANHVRHPAAVGVFETDVAEDGCPFLVMELLEGESLLQQLSRTGEIDPMELLRYVDELLDVLAVAHDAGIVHRDIKLDNLFILKSGGLKVLDFGIARVRSSSITVTGQRLGTIAYMPPEQIRGYEVDGRADLFAVGATMFRAIAKRRVHVAPNEAALIMLMSTASAPPLASVAPGVPAGVAAIVDRALAFYARERYPDARTMQADVRAVLRGEAPPHATRLAGSPPTSPGARGSASGVASGEGAPFVDAPTVVPETPPSPEDAPRGVAYEATMVAPPAASPSPVVAPGSPQVPSGSLPLTSGSPPGSAGGWSVGTTRATQKRAWVIPAALGVAVCALAGLALLLAKLL